MCVLMGVDNQNRTHSKKHFASPARGQKLHRDPLIHADYQPFLSVLVYIYTNSHFSPPLHANKTWANTFHLLLIRKNLELHALLLILCSPYLFSVLFHACFVENGISVCKLE